MIPGLIIQTNIAPGVGATSYANSGGTGDRTGGVVTVTQSGLTLGGGNVTNLVDGANANNTTDGVWVNGTPSAGSYIRFAFSEPKYVDEFKLYMPTTTLGLGTWKWTVSNNANNFTDIEVSSFSLGGSATQTKSVTHVIPNAWLIYQLEYVSGTVNNSWWGEIEFKIVAA